MAVSPRALWAGSGRKHVSKTSAGSKPSRLRVCVQFKKALVSGSRIRGTGQSGTLLGLRHSRNSRVLTLSFHNVACSQNIRFPLSFLFSSVIVLFFALTCKFCSAWRSKQPNFFNSSFFLLRRSKRTLAVYFSVSLVFFFAMRTARSDVQRDAFAIVKNKHSYFCNASDMCIISASFTLPEKYVFAVQQ